MAERGTVASNDAAPERPSARAFLGLGSNLGDRYGRLREARDRLATLPGTSLVGASGLYETAPVGGPDQDDYLNQVVELRTALSPRELLQAAGRIEGSRRLVREEQIDVRQGLAGHDFLAHEMPALVVTVLPQLE